MPRAELWDAYGRPTGHIDFPDPQPAGGYDYAPMGPVTRLVSIVLGFFFLALFVFVVVDVVTTPGRGDPGYCSNSEKVVVGQNWVGLPVRGCPPQ